MNNTKRPHFDDSSYINPESIHIYAKTNEPHLKGEVRGIIVELPGLGGNSCLGGTMESGSYDTVQGKDFGEHGIIIAYIFPGPWSWGNRAAMRITDSVIAALLKKYNLSENIPMAVRGGSMGGLGSLIFAAETRYTLRCVVSACPCVDTLETIRVVPHFGRSLVSAIGGYDMPLEDALKTISPIHRIDDMPHIPYYICSDGKDHLQLAPQCDRFIEAMRERGHEIQYFRQEEREHGDFDPEVWDGIHFFLLEHLLK